MKRIIISAICLFFNISAYSQFIENGALDSLNALKGNRVALNKKLKLLGAGTEDDLSLLLEYYSGSTKSKDSIMQMVLKRFPKGKIVFSKRVSQLYAAQNPTKQAEIIADLQKDHPTESYDRMNYLIAYNFAGAKDTGKAIEYLEKVKGDTRFMALRDVVKAILKYDVEAAELLVANELKKQNTEREQITLLNLYSSMMDKKSDYSKALATIRKYANPTSSTDREFLANYYYTLSKTGDYSNALPGLEKVVVNGDTSKRIVAELKKTYLQLNPDSNVEAYLTNVKKKVGWQFREKTAKKMVKKLAPNFSVTDLNGNVVSLADLKGKTVVLDFWATWCGPCKASLPAMQLIVNKFKKNENVKFLFIHTWEKGPDAKEAAAGYFAENGYDLPLFMDLKDPITNTNKAVSSLGIQGIPAKFVIDKNGFTRFETMGGGASTEAEVQELTAMIDLTIQEK